MLMTARSDRISSRGELEIKKNVTVFQGQAMIQEIRWAARQKVLPGHCISPETFTVIVSHVLQMSPPGDMATEIILVRI